MFFPLLALIAIQKKRKEKKTTTTTRDCPFDILIFNVCGSLGIFELLPPLFAYCWPPPGQQQQQRPNVYKHNTLILAHRERKTNGCQRDRSSEIFLQKAVQTSINIINKHFQIAPRCVRVDTSSSKLSYFFLSDGKLKKQNKKKITRREIKTRNQWDTFLFYIHNPPGQIFE